MLLSSNSDSKMHLIISKWLRTQKCRHKRKTIRQKRSKWKTKLSAKVFLFIWICNWSHKCLLFLLCKYSTLLCVIPSALLYASFQFKLLWSSHRFIAIQILYLNIWIFEKSSTNNNYITEHYSISEIEGPCRLYSNCQIMSITIWTASFLIIMT